MAESIFISSCSRRELARRRPGRTAGTVLIVLLQLLLALIVVGMGLGAVMLARAGL